MESHLFLWQPTPSPEVTQLGDPQENQSAISCSVAYYRRHEPHFTPVGKARGRDFDGREVQFARDLIQEGIIDLGFVGHSYTWNNVYTNKAHIKVG